VLHRKLRVMTEIRLRWSDEVPQEDLGDSRGGLWVPDTPRNRERLSRAIELANSLYGQATHWIEERQA
jgi:hypothetical protein